MTCIFEAKSLTKRFGEKTVLDRIDLRLNGPGIIGLLGRNGCGKTTLMRHIAGQYLPDEGEALTLGTPCGQLGHAELAQIGFVSQEVRLLNWMMVEQHIDFVSSFYPGWDAERANYLLQRLELERGDMVGELSSGSLQKLAIILAVCHHPRFLVLDEPVSDLDPISRSHFLQFLLEVLQDDGATILVSSHVLRDVEKVVDHVVCLHGGRVTVDSALDELKESLMLWLVRFPDEQPAVTFDEPYILEQEISGGQAKLVVQEGTRKLDEFSRAHGVKVTPHPMNLEDMFPWLLRGRM